MQDILKSQLRLRNDLLCKGEFFHVRCSAHIQNLIVQDGLKVIKDSLDKIRDSIKYVKAFGSREQLFERCVETVGLEVNAGLILDVKTRWNSTYHMLDKAIKYQAAFVNLKVIDARNYESLPSEDEWKRVKEMCDFLEPFDKITRLMSGATYPTSNLYFMQVWKIQSWLKDNEFNRDVIIREMVITMTEKFQKYWEEYSDVLEMAAVFDLRFKLMIAEYFFSKLDRSSCEEKLVHLRSRLRVLFEAKERKSKSVSQSSKTRETVQENVGDKEQGGILDNYGDFFAFRKANVVVSGKSSLEVYLEEPPLNFNTFASMDILQFWKDNSPRYGELALMACDLLSIPITTVASESSSSIGAQVLIKYKSRLLPKHIQALIYSRNWLKGFEAYENEDEKFDEDDGTLPTFESILEDES